MTARAASGRNQTHAGKMLIILGLVIVLLVAAIAAMSLGRYYVSPGDILGVIADHLFGTSFISDSKADSVVYNLRLPRMICVMLVGSAIAVSGASYQGLFRNPLVSPDLLGVSSGACVGAASAILLDFQGWGIQLCALAGGLLAVGLTVLIPKLFKNSSILMLILSGVIVGGFLSSIMGILKYIADPYEQLSSIVYWTMGSFASAGWSDVRTFTLPILIAMIIPIALRWRLNLLALGEHDAFFLGTNVKLIRGLLILSSTFLTAMATCISGTIGWVGLIIPHFCRLLLGPDNRYLIPASIIAGAGFMLIVDTMARTLSGSEIPISIFTGALGAPLFIWLLLLQKTKLE